MLLKENCPYTAEELGRLSGQRYFDQITFVTYDLWRSVRNLNDTYGLKDWTIETRTDKTHPQRRTRCEGKLSSLPFSELCAVTHMGNVELCLVQPEYGETVFQQYLSRYGEGLCNVRENIAGDQWERVMSHFREQDIGIVQAEETSTGKTVWFDTLDLWGGLFGVHTGSGNRVVHNHRKLTQINVVTDDVERTVAQLTQLLQIGPWSIGTLNNQSVTNPGLLVNGELTAPEFHFQLGICFPGNLEFEVIQPVKGPTVYRDYLQKHGCGYHHIKEVVPPAAWDQTMNAYHEMGMAISIQGQVGPTSFAYLASEEQFGFVVELGDGLAADPLPQGYNEYQYPQK